MVQLPQAIKTNWYFAMKLPSPISKSICHDLVLDSHFINSLIIKALKPAVLDNQNHIFLVLNSRLPAESPTLLTFTVCSRMVGLVSKNPVANWENTWSFNVWWFMYSTRNSICCRSLSLVALSLDEKSLTTHGRICCWYSDSPSNLPTYRKQKQMFKWFI